MHVIIMRGAPGSGKSTWVNATVQLLGPEFCKVVSADQHRYVGETYVYDSKKNEEVHGKCLRDFLDVVRVPQPGYVFVDNCNTKAWHLAPYYQTAAAFGHVVWVVNMIASWKDLLGRSRHCTSAAATFDMHRDMQVEQLPAHWRQAFITSFSVHDSITYDVHGLPDFFKRKE